MKNNGRETIRGVHSLLKRFVSVFLVLAIVVPMLPAQLPAALAADGDFIVTDSKKTRYQYYDTFEQAWIAACHSNDCIIFMNRDVTLKDRLTLKAKCKVTVNMNGHVINRGNTKPSEILTPSDSSGDGIICYMCAGSTLILNGGNDADSKAREHKGKVYSGVWYYDGNGPVSYSGALLTGSGSNSYECGAVTMESKAHLEAYDVTFAGNVCNTFVKAYGEGAVLLMTEGDGGAFAKLERCGVYYNRAYDNGGVIAMDNHPYGNVQFIDSDIAYNTAGKSGGVIYIEDDSKESNVGLSRSTLHNNLAGEDGGAICIEAQECKVTDGTVRDNEAESGGGIYLQDVDETVSGTKVTGNKASKNGGGIAVMQEDCLLENCTITGNTAGGKGGGVYTDTTNYVYVPKLKLTGTAIIRGNSAAKGGSNLYLDKGTVARNVTIYGVPNLNSEVWVSAGYGKGVITYVPDSYNDTVFHSDDPNYDIYWGQDSSDKDTYRHLVIGKEKGGGVNLTGVWLHPGSEDFKYTGIQTLENTSYTYKGWPVYRGFAQPDMTSETNAYYYSDGYFQQDAREYDEHLASLSLRMAAAGFDSSIFSDSTGDKTWDYKLQPNHVKQMLSDIGMDDEDIWLSNTYYEKPGMDTVACAFGSKKLKLQDMKTDSEYTLIAVVVRGAGYELEWSSNVTLGEDTENSKVVEHSGFRNAADQVMSNLALYLAEHPELQEELDKGKVRFWVTGFSRGGATANLTSKRLIDKYQKDGNVIYGYTMEAPQGGVTAQEDSARDYKTIHNVVLPADLVPHVAMISLGFKRYGVDHYLPGSPAGYAGSFSRRYYNYLTPRAQNRNDEDFLKDNTAYTTDSREYQEQKKIMLPQLAASDHSVNFDDYFHLATVGVKSAVSRSAFLEVGSDKVTAAQWLPDFVYYVNEWLTGEVSNSRDIYAAQFQETMRDSMKFLMDRDKHLDMDRILDRVGDFSLVMDVLDVLVRDYTSDQMLEKLAQVLVDYKVFADDCIPLTKEEGKALLDVALKVVLRDFKTTSQYSQGTSVEYDTGSEYLIMLPTLLYNMSRIKQNHQTEVVFAWLRSYDSYYTQNKDGICDNYYLQKAAEQDKVRKPYLTYRVNGELRTLQDGGSDAIGDNEEVTEIVLHNQDGNKGGLIFYDAAAGGVEKSRRYYDTAYLKTIGSEIKTAGSVTIEAETVWHDTPSGKATFVLYRDKTPALYIRDDSGEYQLYAKAKAGAAVTYTPDLPEGWEITGWEVDTGRTARAFSWDNDADGTLHVTMPDCDVYMIPLKKQKKVEAPVSSLADGTYAYDQLMELSTPSGTGEDGFSIEYTRIGGGCWDGYSETADYTDAIDLYGSEKGKAIWTVKAQAFHDGWEPSDVSTFEIVIDYTQRLYTVRVVCGTLPDGTASGTFHPGETVKVTASVPEDNVFKAWTADSGDVAFSDGGKYKEASFTMPFGDVTVTAELEEEKRYPITVEDGKAYDEDGNEIDSAKAGQLVCIVARDPKTDENDIETEHFLNWEGYNYTELAEPTASSTTFRMPTDSRLTGGVYLKAVFSSLYKITVTNGSAYDENDIPAFYAAQDEKITVVPDMPDCAEYRMAAWSFSPELGGKIDLTQRTLTFTMPGHDVTATAEFEYAVRVINGTAADKEGKIIGYALPGEKVYLTADEPEAGMVFAYWKAKEGLWNSLDSMTARSRFPALIAAALADNEISVQGDTLTMPESAVTVQAFYQELPPETGDTATPGTWACLSLASLAGLLFLMRKRRKNGAE